MGSHLPTMHPRLARAYAQPNRHYHNLAHIHDCLAELARIADRISPRDHRALQLAIWWHDAIYEPGRPDNEERSAEVCARALDEAGTDHDLRDEVVRLILLTKHHKVPPNDQLGAMMVSIDLSILGRPPAEYDAYADAIRKEYQAVPDDAFNAGRRAALGKFLESAAIYPDANFRTRYEQQARKNIQREIDRLEHFPVKWQTGSP